MIISIFHPFLRTLWIYTFFLIVRVHIINSRTSIVTWMNVLYFSFMFWKCAKSFRCSVWNQYTLIVTFRVARLTLQTRKLWLIGVTTDRDVRNACLRFFSFFFFMFFSLPAYKKSKNKKTNQKRSFTQKKKKVSNGNPRDGSKKCFLTLKVVLRPSGVLLVCFSSFIQFSILSRNPVDSLSPHYIGSQYKSSTCFFFIFFRTLFHFHALWHDWPIHTAEIAKIPILPRVIDQWFHL